MCQSSWRLQYFRCSCRSAALRRSTEASGRRPHPGEHQQLIFSTGFSGLIWTANRGRLSRRSGAQSGVVPHLCTNFRVSRTPNRRTALPWQQLTAKSTVYFLIGAPQIISHLYTHCHSKLSFPNTEHLGEVNLGEIRVFHQFLLIKH